MKITISNEKMHSITPGMFGLFFEDINYAADGGLYAEMIENRNFEAFRASGTNNEYCHEYDGLYAWSKYPKDCPFVAMETRTVTPLTEANPHYLHIRTWRANSGFGNRAYDGLCLKKGMGYRVSFFANTPLFTGEIEFRIEKEGDIIFSESFSTAGKKGWTEYGFEFDSPVSVRNASPVIVLRTPGEADFDFISVFPKDAVSGVFRKDLADLLRDLHPGFLRFPGGCVVEGNTLENRYQWKRSIGDPKDRIANWNRWAVHGTGRENNYTSRFPHYNQTLGIGFFEYFLLCEYIGAKALPVLNVGLACQYQSKELVETTDPAFREFIDDALDLIEFANGDVSTKWGSIRAEMGHPLPFGLEYIGIGNEQWETENVNFYERYMLFEEAIHKTAPEMKLIGSAGPDVHTDRWRSAWDFYRKNAGKKGFAYAVDEHYYMAPEWFLENTGFYDEYDRSVKVFSGEYAAHPKRLGGDRSGNTLLGALSEAAFLTGVERNSDVVVMSSYAPLFAREGYVQWAPDLIWFNDATAYGTPSYYVQRMFSNNTGSDIVKFGTDCDCKEEGLFVSSAFDEKKNELIIRLVNVNETEKKVNIVLNGFGEPKYVEGELLCGRSPSAYNTSDDPFCVKPYSFGGKKFDPDRTVEAYSFTVIRLGFTDRTTGD